MNKKRTKKDIKEAALSQDMSKDKSSKDNPRPNHVSDLGDNVENKNTGEDSEPITEPSKNKEEPVFNVDKKILELINKVPEFRNRIADHDKEWGYYPFSNSYGFHRRRTFLKFKSAKLMMDLKLECRGNKVMNDSDSASDYLVVNELLGDFVRSESSMVGMRNVGYYAHNIRYDEKIQKFVRINDNSLQSSIIDLEIFESVIFNKENWELITFYYLEYIWFFPITIKEFEKSLFIFLLYITQKSYSLSLDVNDLFLLKDELNAVLSSKYINFSDFFTLICFYIFGADPELNQMGEEIFEDASIKIEMVKQQVNGVGS